MNLYTTRPWEQPHFARRTILPIIPFILTAFVLIGFGGYTDLQSHRILSDLQAQIPTTDLAKVDTDELATYNAYRILLTQLYATNDTTLAGLRAISAVSSIRPKTVRLSNVTISPDGNQVTLAADTPDPQHDVNSFISSATKRNWQFQLTSLTSPANGIYQMQGVLTMPIPTPTSAPSIITNLQTPRQYRPTTARPGTPTKT
jgi:hypothetical protein